MEVLIDPPKKIALNIAFFYLKILKKCWFLYIFLTTVTNGQQLCGWGWLHTGVSHCQLSLLYISIRPGIVEVTLLVIYRLVSGLSPL